MANRLGQQFGNYRLVALLGQGSYAEVYLGQHVQLDLQAAIKVLHGHLSSSEAERFQQEAQTMERLTHPSIVRVFDFAVQDGIPFLIMEYAPNGSLRQRYPEDSILSLPEILPSIKQVAAALQYAHEQKYIHRDVKPENMLLGRHNEVLLSDFGLAALARSTASLNTEGTVGTIAYIAPEQIEGYPRAASDQYTLAVVIYEWLCGVRPFEGSATEIVVKQLGAPPPPLRKHVTTISAAVEQVVLRALAKDPKERFASVAAFATELEQASQLAPSHTSLLPMEQPSQEPSILQSYTTVAVGQEAGVEKATPPAEQVATPLLPAISSGSSHSSMQGATQHSQAADVPLLPKPVRKLQRRNVSRRTAGLLIGLLVLIIAGTLLGSVSLLAHFGVIGTHSGSIMPMVRGGTWTDDTLDPDSLIPNGGSDGGGMDQALYLPLFYGDAQGIVHPGAAREMPSMQNGGISADATTWTFHLKPHLVWSDGAPYDARDVDYTWKLWLNPKFGAVFPNGAAGFELIRSADVSADHLSISFHLTHAYAPFLQYWVDGDFAPLPVHHFSRMAPEQILKSSDNLNPKVVSGPFVLAESLPGDHYTLMRNPRYYRASEGLPYLDKVVFRSVEQNARLKDLHAGTITSAWRVAVDASKVQAYQHLSSYTLVTSPTSATFEALWFNFHNTVLATHPEVRQAMAMAIDQQSLIQVARQGFATTLCTDHPSALHPGYQPFVSCPEFDLALANQLLSDNGWVKGSDGVRTREGQRLSFEFSICTSCGSGRLAGEAIIARNFQEIGIKLDIHNYPGDTFFGSFLPGGKASPPTGAIAGRYDIAEWANTFGYDPDDSPLFSCDQIPPTGGNFTFYCNRTLDSLYQQELATADPGERQQIFDQIHQIYLTQFPLIVLYSPTDLSILRKGTHNYLPSALSLAADTINIWEWWCDNGKC